MVVAYVCAGCKYSLLCVCVSVGRVQLVGGEVEHTARQIAGSVPREGPVSSDGEGAEDEAGAGGQGLCSACEAHLEVAPSASLCIQGLVQDLGRTGITPYTRTHTE